MDFTAVDSLCICYSTNPQHTEISIFDLISTSTVSMIFVSTSRAISRRRLQTLCFRSLVQLVRDVNVNVNVNVDL